MHMVHYLSFTQCISDDDIVGLILIRFYDDGKNYILDQMIIDSKYQKKGFGTEALSILLNILSEERKYDNIILCYIEGNDVAMDFYEKNGFRHNGVVDEDEIVKEFKFWYLDTSVIAPYNIMFLLRVDRRQRLCSYKIDQIRPPRVQLSTVMIAPHHLTGLCQQVHLRAYDLSVIVIKAFGVI